MSREHFRKLREYRQRVPSELAGVYSDLTAENVAPNIAAAAVVYYGQSWGYGDGPRETQDEVGEAFRCSAVAIRNHREAVVPRLRLVARQQRGDSA